MVSAVNDHLIDVRGCDGANLSSLNLEEFATGKVFTAEEFHIRGRILERSFEEPNSKSRFWEKK